VPRAGSLRHRPGVGGGAAEEAAALVGWGLGRLWVRGGSEADGATCAHEHAGDGGQARLQRILPRARLLQLLRRRRSSSGGVSVRARKLWEEGAREGVGGGAWSMCARSSSRFCRQTKSSCCLASRFSLRRLIFSRSQERTFSCSPLGSRGAFRRISLNSASCPCLQAGWH
jgi:hypothetical protein